LLDCTKLFIYQPWEFGSPWTKKTALWGVFNKPDRIYKKWEHITPEGFKPNYDIVYDGVWDMINAYEESEVNNG